MSSLQLLAPATASDTFFTRAPHWEWAVILYFFVGGLAGGSYFLAAMLDLFGAPVDRAVARLGYYVAFPAMVLGGLLLIVDLDQPARFWHMLIQSHKGWPMFKWWSPISFGAWALGVFSVCAFLSLLGVLAETGRLPAALGIFHDGALGRVISAAGGLLGLFVGGYTGVLLEATNRPLWGDTSFLGLLFLVSAVSASAALLILLAQRRANPASVEWLGRMDASSLVIELVVLLLVVVSLGSVASDVWGNGWGVLLAIGVVLIGILVPLTLHWRPRLLGRMSLPSAAALVLIGGFILRIVVVLSSERA